MGYKRFEPSKHLNESMKIIEVRAATTQQDVLNHQCDVINVCDSLKEAKARAKYLLSEPYHRLSEASTPLGYAQVVVDGECLYDYFSK